MSRVLLRWWPKICNSSPELLVHLPLRCYRDVNIGFPAIEVVKWA